ncbi:MAG: flavin reductase [Cyclobacteriaceae bacterium]|jgi:flavin reductase (DIM6/NTAB) family NADH-FMN oxidoreductase RutF
MRRPWNIAESQVYSLATYFEDRVNMNICTYVSVVSKNPRLYAMAIDYHSHTYSNLLENGKAVLQILSIQNMKVVNSLGKKSGNTFDKQKYLESNELLCTWKSFKVLKNAIAYLEVDVKKSLNIGGDHELFIFDIISSKTNSEKNILTFQELIEQRIIL